MRDHSDPAYQNKIADALTAGTDLKHPGKARAFLRHVFAFSEDKELNFIALPVARRLMANDEWPERLSVRELVDFTRERKEAFMLVSMAKRHIGFDSEIELIVGVTNALAQRVGLPLIVDHPGHGP